MLLKRLVTVTGKVISRHGPGLIIVLIALIAMSRVYPPLFMRYPPVWPDEGLFSSPALDLLGRGHMGTHLIGDLIPGMADHTYWMPPAYFVILAGVFRAFGIGIVQMRLLSVITGFGVLFMSYLVCFKATRRSWLSGLAVASLCMEPMFVRASSIGRMDMLAVLFTLISLYLYPILTDGVVVGKSHRFTAFLSGLFGALAFSTHPLGAVALGSIILHSVFTAVRNRRFSAFQGYLALGAVLGLLPWLVYVIQAPSDFLKQFGGQLIRKADREPLGWGILQVPFGEFGNRKVHAIALFIAGMAGLITGGRKTAPYSLALVLSFAVVAVSREMWYPVYYLPYVSVGTIVLISLGLDGIRRIYRESADTAVRSLWFPFFRRISEILICSLILFTAVHRGYSDLQQLSGTYKARAADTDYSAYCKAIGAALPFGSQIVVAAIPDPFLGLTVLRPDLTIYHFVPEGVPMDEAAYLGRLGSSDYIVTTDHLQGTAVGRFADEGGAILTTEIGLHDGFAYHARIYKVY